MLKYKGYIGVAEYDDVGKIFTGEVAGLASVITFKEEPPKSWKPLSMSQSISTWICVARMVSSQKRPIQGDLMSG